MKRKKRPLLAGALVLILGVALTAAVLADALDTSGGNFSTENSRSGLTADCTYSHTQTIGENGTGSAKFAGEDVIQLAAASYYNRVIWTTTDIVTVTLTLTNSASYPQTLSFTLAASLVSDATYTVTANGESKQNTPGKYSYELAAGGTCEIKLVSATPSADTTGKNSTVTISGIKLASDSAQVTFYPAENGSYSVGGTAVGSGTTIGYTEDTRIVLTPESGYEFACWMYCDGSGNTTGNIYSTIQQFAPSDAASIKPVFKRTGSATYQVSGLAYYYLDEAIAAAGNSGTIIVTGSGTVYHSNGVTSSFTIPSGVTLLVPFDGNHTEYKENNDFSSSILGTTNNTGITRDIKQAPTAYRTLTIPSGANITVNGAVEVGGRLYAPAGGEIAYITGSVGLIKMAGGSSITVESGGKLYAWGFIARNGANDEGSITAKSGSAVYEYLQFGFRGGTASSDSNAKDNRVFPVSQYFVQNVEVPMTIEHGASEKIAFGAYANTTRTLAVSSALFVSGAGAMFNLGGGSFTKNYDESTDRMIFSIQQDSVATLNELSLDISGVSIQSSGYDLPINHCITLNLLSGSTLNVSKPVALLPGVKISIAAGATINIESNAYVYDRDDWINRPNNGGTANYAMSGKQFVAALHVSPGLSRYTRTNSDLVDVEVDINGTMNVTGTGAIYTTNGGAAIISSEGTGVFNQSVAPVTASTTHQVAVQKTTTKAGEFDAIPITAAKLKNADSTYTETAGAAAGDVFRYVNGKWINAKVLTLYANDGSDQSTTQYVEKGVATPLPTCSFTRSGYRFSQWATAADGSGTTYADGASVTAAADLALYAQWIQITYSLNISWAQTSTAVYTETTTYAWDTEALRYTPTTSGSWTTAASTLTITLDNSASTGAVNASFNWTADSSVTSTAAWDGGTTSMTLAARQKNATKTLTVTPTAAPPSGKQNGDSFDLGTVTITIRKKQ